MPELNTQSRSVETLRWREGRLEMIDQRMLPESVEYRSFHSAAETAQGIRSMVVRGAPAIGCAAAYGVALEAQRLSAVPRNEFGMAMEQGFAVLAASRPTAVNLFWALQRMRAVMEAVRGHTVVEIADRLLREARAIQEEDVQINHRLGANGAALLPDGARVLTHCNAGALATAGHGTALGVFRSAVEAGKRISVIADETRPFLQGARLTAWEMMQEGIPVTLITDNMAGHLMHCGDIDAVVVGADRVAANGDVANKIGTYMVAVLAHRHRIPFYVASPLSTFDMTLASGSEIPIEERSAAEVMGFREQCWAPAGIRVRNPAFDITPAELITGLITEKQVILAPTKDKLLTLFADTHG